MSSNRRVGEYLNYMGLMTHSLGGGDGSGVILHSRLP